MPILEISKNAPVHEYGILCRRVFPHAELPTPFGATQCVVPPFARTDPHRHEEGETFFLADGAGRMAIDGAWRAVTAGDVVYIPAGAEHVLENAGATPLSFLSVWWQPEPKPRARDTLVTAAPPTPNGDLHLGHLSGPYVAADAHARFLRMTGGEVRFLTGSDDNQSYVDVKGMREGRPARAVAAYYADAVERTLARAGCAVDVFVRPGATPGYVPAVQEFLAKLVTSGNVEVRDGLSLFCDTCDRYLYEAHVGGGCPTCGARTNGQGCEPCGRYNDAVDLVDPRCNHCGTAAVKRPHRRLVFPLERWRRELEAYWSRVAMSPRLKALTSQLARGLLPDVTVTHAAPWGIPALGVGVDGHVIYEWLEMAAGYRFAGKDAFVKEDADVVQFFGFDNAFFYTTFIPAVLMAHDASVRLPAAFVTNEFYRLDGLKFSTSRNHAIWGPEALAHVPADVVRFFLAHDRPEDEETSFSLERFRATVASELADEWDPWLAGLETRLGGVAPAAGSLSAPQQRFLAELRGLVARAAEALAAPSFSLRRLARVITQIVRAARALAASHAPLADDPAHAAEYATSLALELSAVRALARVAAPLMPRTAEDLATALGDDALAWDADAGFVTAGRTIRTFGAVRFAPALDGIAALTSAREGRS
jgi:methionyl-tRNA synthetase